MELELALTLRAMAGLGAPAVPAVNPWTMQNITATHLGGGEWRLVSNGAGVYDAQAQILRDGDFRLRIKPRQSNIAVSVGLDGVTGAVVDNGSLDEQLALRSDMGYSGSTGYVVNSGGGVATYSYAALPFFWFERIGTVSTIYLGGDGSFGTAASFYAWATDTSDTDYLKVIIRDITGGVDLLYSAI